MMYTCIQFFTKIATTADSSPHLLERFIVLYAVDSYSASKVTESTIGHFLVLSVQLTVRHYFSNFKETYNYFSPLWLLFFFVTCTQRNGRALYMRAPNTTYKVLLSCACAPAPQLELKTSVTLSALSEWNLNFFPTNFIVRLDNILETCFPVLNFIFQGQEGDCDASHCTVSKDAVQAQYGKQCGHMCQIFSLSVERHDCCLCETKTTIKVTGWWLFVCVHNIEI